MVYCFDTSAINALHSDPDCGAITTGLLASGVVRVAALNVIEACGTADSTSRESLLRLLNRLRGTYKVIAMPNELCQLMADMHSRGDASQHIPMGAEQPEYDLVLFEPEKADEGLRQQIYDWKREIEGPFKEANIEARPSFQRLFDDGKANRPTSAGEMLRRTCRDTVFVHGFASRLYRGITGKELSAEELVPFFSRFREWPLYLFGWAYSAYERAVQRDNYGAKRKAGSIDLWFAVHLPCCDVFVTDDNAQRKALRLANVLNSGKTRVLSYGQLRRRLIVDV